MQRRSRRERCESQGFTGKGEVFIKARAQADALKAQDSAPQRARFHEDWFGDKRMAELIHRRDQLYAYRRRSRALARRR